MYNHVSLSNLDVLFRFSRFSDGSRMEPEPEKGATEETLVELCKQADAEQDLDKLLDLASKIQRLIDARRSQKNHQPK